MKRLTLCFAMVAALLMAGCGHEKKEFATRTLAGRQCYQISFAEELDPWGETAGLKKTCSVQWPAEGLLSAAAERELIQLCFGDSTSASIDAALQAWLAKPYLFIEDDTDSDCKPVDTLDESQEHSYVNIECTAQNDSVLATFVVKTESYGIGAAHGFYTADYLTVDLESGNAVHLTDLVADTNLLCEAIARAIFDLDANKDVRECLFDEYRNADRMPMPASFFIDSTHSGITVVYGLYEVQPYACGIPSVVLPIFWLSKHVELTPYAKRLFGPGSYIEE